MIQGTKESIKGSVKSLSVLNDPEHVEAFLGHLSQTAGGACSWNGCCYDSTFYSKAFEKVSKKDFEGEDSIIVPELLTLRSRKEQVLVSRRTAAKKCNTLEHRKQEKMEKGIKESPKRRADDC